MRRALVTGATGGLGIAVVEALVAEGYAVRASGRDPTRGQRLTALGAEFFPGEITDPGYCARAAEGMDVVFHAAALSSPWGDPGTFQAVNVDATLYLLNAARASGADAFVFVSTPSIYAEPADRPRLTEASPLPPRFMNAYAETKHTAETLVLAADAPGFATVAVRPRAIVGPDDQVLLPRLLRVAARGRFPVFRGGQALIDMTDARDAARALVLADKHRDAAAGHAFNVSGGAPLRLRELLPLIFDALELKVRLVDLPLAPLSAAAQLLEGLYARLPGRPEPPVTAYSLNTLAYTQTFDLARAREVLGYEPRHSIAEAVARTAAAWRAHAPV